MSLSVTEGTALGPLFFILFINNIIDIFNIVKLSFLRLLSVFVILLIAVIHNGSLTENNAQRHLYYK